MLGGVRGCEWGRSGSVQWSPISQLPQVTVNIYDGTYSPSELSVRPGTIVVWANRGTTPHTATSWDFFNTGVLRPGDQCATWFVTPGTYPFLSIVTADGGALLGVLSVEGPPIGNGGGPGGPAPSPGTRPMGGGY
jgi:plastocyanin